MTRHNGFDARICDSRQKSGPDRRCSEPASQCHLGILGADRRDGRWCICDRGWLAQQVSISAEALSGDTGWMSEPRSWPTGEGTSGRYVDFGRPHCSCCVVRRQPFSPPLVQHVLQLTQCFCAVDGRRSARDRRGRLPTALTNDAAYCELFSVRGLSLASAVAAHRSERLVAHRTDVVQRASHAGEEGRPAAQRIRIRTARPLSRVVD